MHGDLPFATSLDEVAGDGAAPIAVLVPDHRDDGTPVCALPVDGAVRVRLRRGFVRAARAEVRRIGLELRIVRDDALGFDVDLPEDLARLESPCP